MESIVTLYQEEYEQLYKHKIFKRREQMKLNIGDIKSH